MIKNSNGKVSRPHMVLYPSLEGMYGLQLNKALAGHVTPEQAMEEAQIQFEDDPEAELLSSIPNGRV